MSSESKVTVQLITNYLEKFGWDKYASVSEPTEREGFIVTGWLSSSGDSERYGMVIDPVVERGFLSFRVPEILTVSEISKDLLIAINFINHNLILGKFSYDSMTGKVVFSLNVSIQGGTITYEQFKHCLLATVVTTEKYAPRLKEIATGEKKLEEFINQEMADQSTAITLATLEKIFEEVVERKKDEVNLH